MAAFDTWQFSILNDTFQIVLKINSVWILSPSNRLINNYKSHQFSLNHGLFAVFSRCVSEADLWNWWSCCSAEAPTSSTSAGLWLWAWSAATDPRSFSCWPASGWTSTTAPSASGASGWAAWTPPGSAPCWLKEAEHTVSVTTTVRKSWCIFDFLD